MPDVTWVVSKPVYVHVTHVYKTNDLDSTQAGSRNPFFLNAKSLAAYS